ncbi:MCE family protein [Amycolatopsis aidingensis]|uniref:MCE family protein n=1 Tax=Amycolatopsis aidingensis TaxID=2842453 RepID=UPI001C0E5DEC|nr:MCE family protein [Amycolatopsis aidingensis]
MIRRFGALAAVLLLVGVATGCSQDGFDGVYDVPLPGGPDLGANPYHVTASFTNVLDLVPQSGVRVNDVGVGKVQEIELAHDGKTALVTMAVRGDVRLPANAVALLRQSSVLGEKFVELAPPELEQPRGRLAEGATIPVERTNRNTEIEEVFGALSLLLNGGGVAQIQTITRELNKALGGNEQETKELLGNLNTLVTGLDEHRTEISRALDGVAKLGKTLSGRKEQIDTALTDLTPGIETLSQQREQLVTLLKSLANLSDVAVETVNKSKEDLVADLRALEPILRRLAESGDALPKAMEMLLTYPFPDSALEAIKGDYLNSYVNFDSATG